MAICLFLFVISNQVLFVFKSLSKQQMCIFQGQALMSVWRRQIEIRCRDILAKCSTKPDIWFVFRGISLKVFFDISNRRLFCCCKILVKRLDFVRSISEWRSTNLGQLRLIVKEKWSNIEASIIYQYIIYHISHHLEACLAVSSSFLHLLR